MPDNLSSKLLKAADQINSLSTAEIQVLLRQAALHVRRQAQSDGTTILMREVYEVMGEYAAVTSITRDEAVNAALLDWAIAMGLIEIEDLD